MVSEPLLTALFKQRQQFSTVIDVMASSPIKLPASQLKTQLIILSQWLWLLSDDSADIIQAQCLYQPKQYSQLANKSFCAGVLTRGLCYQLNWHGHSAKTLISAALVMDLGLAIDCPTLTAGWFDLKTLSPHQRTSYRNHPLTGASYLHKHLIIKKQSLKSIMEHHELLDGSGFPKKLRGYQTSTAGKILSLVSKFCELVSKHPKRASYTVKQALRYLAQRPNQYCADLLRHLSVTLNKPAITGTVQLKNQQFALIYDFNQATQQASIIEFNGQQPSLNHQITQIASSNIANITANNKIYDEKKFAKIWAELELHTRKDYSNSSQRLRPHKVLNLLLEQLELDTPDPQLMTQLIAQDQQLGDAFIEVLQQQYPNKNFNNSYHALKMAGFYQSKPLVSLIGLQQQLNQFDFPIRRTLSQKINLAVAVSRVATQYTSCVLPNQAAIFTLLNLAPLYFDHFIISLPNRSPVKLNELNLTLGYSLVGLAECPQQAKLTYSLAKQWDNRNQTLLALKMINNELNQATLYQEEIINIFKLSILLTHHIYHGIKLEDPLLSMATKSHFRIMSLERHDVKAIIESALSCGPFCELRQQL
ncbi:MAG: hypothetical protein HRU24_01700 [Gammaproteobacteria bacterium]|nr:hypothetical protein [Gammaproteobacteria bacterium]